MGLGMTKRDKKLVKSALDALHHYWGVQGMYEFGGDEHPKCGDKYQCDGCIECDPELTWDAWIEAEGKLKEAIA